jgi:N-acyl amino acid synthase of PEP-CTERM/exosortase system
VSRLAVISGYRLRRGEQGRPVGLTEESFGTRRLPRFPYIPVGLYLGTIELAAAHGIDTLFVLTEPRLAVHFARLGVAIKRIGSAVQHRGARVPSSMSVSGIIGGLNFLVRPLYKEIAKEVRQGLEMQKAPLL